MSNKLEFLAELLTVQRDVILSIEVLRNGRFFGEVNDGSFQLISANAKHLESLLEDLNCQAEEYED